MSQDKSHSIKIEFEDNDYLPYLYGHHNSNLAHIEKALDVTLDSFGNIIQITGSRDNAATAKNTIEALYRRIANDTGPTVMFPSVWSRTPCAGPAQARPA